MLTKEQTKKAEAIREKIAPLCAECQELAKIYNKHSAAAGRAYRVRLAWETVGRSGHALDVYSAEEVAKMEQLRKENPREWSRLYHEASAKEDKADNLARVDLINLKNMLSYTARTLGELIGSAQEWEAHKAAESLAQFLRVGDSGDPFAVLFSFGRSFGSSLVDVSACCLHYWAKDYAAQRGGKPYRLTVAKYNAVIKKLKAIKEEAEQLQTKSRETARAGMVWGFVPFIIDIKESL